MKEKLAEEYAERVCNGQFPIEYTRSQVVAHTKADFIAGWEAKEASIGGDEIRYSEDDGYYWVKNTPYTDGEILEVIKNKTYYSPLTKAK